MGLPDVAAKRIAVIGASGGIGNAVVRQLVAQGHEVIACARQEPASLPAGCPVVFVDLEDETTIAAAASEVGPTLDEVWVVTGLLHDAKRSVQPEKALRQIDPARFAVSLAINTIGPIIVAKHFIPLMGRDRRGLFAAISARVGSIEDNRIGGWYSYRASKAALNQLLRTLSIELARTHTNVVVAGLHPGTVDTDLSKPFQRGVPEGKLFTAERSAKCLVQVANGLSSRDSGRVFAWDGQPVPA